MNNARSTSERTSSKVTTGPSLRKVKKYIDNRALGMTKQKSLELAGYSEGIQRAPGVVEKQNSYAAMIKATSEQNAMSMMKISEKISKDIRDGEMGPKTLQKTQIMKNLAQIEDILAPKIVMRESIDKNGNKTKTTQWGASLVKDTHEVQ